MCIGLVRLIGPIAACMPAVLAGAVMARDPGESRAWRPTTCINGATTMPYSLEEDIASAGRAGFQQIEIWAGKLDAYLKEHSVADLKRLLAQAKITPASMCPYSLTMFGDVEAGLQAITRASQVAAQIGCPVLLVCPDAPPAGMPPDEAFRKAGREARRYAEAAAKYGVKVAVEPLGMHPFIPGPKEALRLIKEANHPSLGLMMDTFHYYKSGVPLDDIKAIPVERLFIVHVNDCEDRPLAELNDGHRLYLGKGVLPLTDILRILKTKGYRGALSVEIFRQEYWNRPADEIAREAKKSLDDALAKVR